MSKTKVLLGFMACMPLSTQSFAQPEFYIGLGAGPQHANFKQRALVTRRTADILINFTALDKTHVAGKGYFGSFFAGLGLRYPFCNSDCEDGYLGLEANADYRHTRFRATNDEFIRLNFNHTVYKMGRDFGLSLMPGVIFSECTLFYARLGYVNGRIKTDTTDISLENVQKNRNGFRYGLGFRQSISECIAFRIDYSQAKYKRVKMSTFDPAGGVGKSTVLTPYTQRFEFGMMYTF